MTDIPATPVSDPEPPKDNEVDHALWVARHEAADTPVDPASHEGLLSRIVHAWRIHRQAPAVAQPLHAETLDALVAEHEASGVTPDDDAKVAAKATLLAAETAAKVIADAADPLPTEPFGQEPAPQAPDPILDPPAPEPEPAPEAPVEVPAEPVNVTTLAEQQGVPVVDAPPQADTIETDLAAAIAAAQKAEADLAAAQAAAAAKQTP